MTVVPGRAGHRYVLQEPSKGGVLPSVGVFHEDSVSELQNYGQNYRITARITELHMRQVAAVIEQKEENKRGNITMTIWLPANNKNKEPPKYI